MSVMVVAGVTRPPATGARCGGEARGKIMVDPTQAWTKLFEVYTDGDNVWATRDGALVASQHIGQDIDGPEVALQTAVRDVAQRATEAVAEIELVVR